jgi:hypothetical protein
MKKLILFVFTVCSIGFLFSCKSEKKEVAPEENALIDVPKSDFTKDDTTQVFALVNDFLDRMRNNDIGAAVSMLYFLDGDTLRELTKQQFNRQAMTLVNARGINYDLERLVFDTEKKNDVKISVTLFENKPGEHRPNKIGFHLKPVRRDGSWFLTTPDNITDTNTHEVEED